MWQYNNTDELCHYGVLGMRWGHRRYQNEDGSLTNAGKKRYDKMSPDKLNKILKKEVRKIRSKSGERTGWSNKFIWNNTIGENSKQAITSYIKKMKQIDDKYNNKVQKLDKLYRNKKISYVDGVKKVDDLIYERQNEYKNMGAAKVIGEKYSKEAIKHIGEVNIGYLKDLGYNKQTSTYLNKKLLKSKRVSIY